MWHKQKGWELRRESVEEGLTLLTGVREKANLAST